MRKMIGAMGAALALFATSGARLGAVLQQPSEPLRRAPARAAAQLAAARGARAIRHLRAAPARSRAMTSLQYKLRL